MRYVITTIDDLKAYISDHVIAIDEIEMGVLLEFVANHPDCPRYGTDWTLFLRSIDFVDVLYEVIK